MAQRDSNGRFVKGNTAAQGGNGGRPRRSVEEKYIKALSRSVTMKDWDKIITVAVQFAKAGDARARQWLSDYLIGKPIQRTEITGADGGPMEHKIVAFEKMVDRIYGDENGG